MLFQLLRPQSLWSSLTPLFHSYLTSNLSGNPIVSAYFQNISTIWPLLATPVLTPILAIISYLLVMMRILPPNWSCYPSAQNLKLVAVFFSQMATHSSVLAWRIPGMAEPRGLPSMGSHRVRHDWSNLAAAFLPEQRANYFQETIIPYKILPSVTIFLFTPFLLLEQTSIPPPQGLCTSISFA